MSGGNFTLAAFFWVVFLVVGLFLMTGAVVSSVWIAVVAFSVVWVPLTLGLVWLMFRNEGDGR